MDISEKLVTIAENEQKASDANARLEQILYGTDTGGKSYYDEFWDGYQENGNKTNYGHAFAGPSWNDKLFDPKYKVIQPTSSYRMFASTRIKDLKSVCENRGITIDLSKSTYVVYLFTESYSLTSVPEINLSNASGLQYVFQYCTALKSIEKLVISSTQKQSYSNTFQRCDALQQIAIEGTFFGSVSFQWSPLTAESAISIITHLKDYKGTDSEFANTLTLSSSTLDLLDAEGATSPNGNTWRDYMEDIGWLIN